MDFLFELLIDFVIEFLVASGEEALSSKKKPSVGKFVLGIIGMLTCLAIIILMIVFGFRQLKESVILGIMFIALGIGFLIGFIIKFVVTLVFRLVKRDK